jgi:hypothetical protein
VLRAFVELCCIEDYKLRIEEETIVIQDSIEDCSLIRNTVSKVHMCAIYTF